MQSRRKSFSIHAIGGFLGLKTDETHAYTRIPFHSKIFREQCEQEINILIVFFFFFVAIFDWVPSSVGLELVLWIFSIVLRLSQVNPFISFGFIARDWNKEPKLNDKNPHPKKRYSPWVLLLFAIRTDLCSLLNTD